MKDIKNKISTKLIILCTIFLVLFNTFVPYVSYAEEASTGSTQSSDESEKQDWAGSLFQPIANAICGLGDGIINVLQGYMLPCSPTAVKKRSQAELLLGDGGFWSVIITVDTVAAGIPFLGDKLTDITATVGNWGSNIYNWINKKFNNSDEEIPNMSGDDIQDMLKKMPYPFIFYSPGAIFSNRIPALDVNFINPSVRNPFLYNEDGSQKTEEEINKVVAQLAAENGVEWDYLKKWNQETQDSVNNEVVQKLQNEINSQLQNAPQEYIDKQVEIAVNALGNKATEQEKEAKKQEIEELAKEGLLGNTASALQKTIQKWYYSIRNIAIVGLLIVLVYIGIRIMISSTADETAKYKVLLKEWVMALVLVFLMHYLMLIILAIVDNIIKMIATAIDFSTGDTLMNMIRILAGQASADEKFIEEMGYGIMYLVLVFYTAMFTWQYIKRVIYMAFLTIIAPLVALTYPLDKIKDGKSQAFNMWLKEYVYNLLLQPIHLLIYIIFVVSAMELATSNMIYALVAIGFIMQAEGFIKKMFGIAPEGGAGKGGFASGALVGSAISAIRSGSQRVTGAISSTGSNKSNDKVRTVDNASSSEAKDIGLDAFDTGEEIPQIEGGTQQTPHITIPAAQNQVTNMPIIDGGNRELDPNSSVDMMYANGYGNPDLLDDILGGGTNSQQVQTIPEITTGNGSSENNNSDADILLPPQKKVLTKRERVGGGLKEVFKGPTVSVLKGLSKGALKLSLGAVGAATLGSVGIAAGLAGKDFDEVLKYGAAGIAGGAFVGSQVGQQGINLTKTIAGGVKSMPERYKKGSMTDDEYKEHIREVENKETRKQMEKDIDKQYVEKDAKKKKEQMRALMDAGLTGEKEIKKGMELMDMQEVGKTKRGDTIEKVTDTKKAAKRAAGVVSMARVFTDKDAAAKPDEVEKYINKKVNGESGQKAAKELFYGFHDLKRKD